MQSLILVCFTLFTVSMLSLIYLQNKQDGISRERNLNNHAHQYELTDEERVKFNALQRAKIHKKNMDQVIRQIAQELQQTSFKTTDKSLAYNGQNSPQLSRSEISQVILDYTQFFTGSSKDSQELIDEKFNQIIMSEIMKYRTEEHVNFDSSMYSYSNDLVNLMVKRKSSKRKVSNTTGRDLSEVLSSQELTSGQIQRLIHGMRSDTDLRVNTQGMGVSNIFDDSVSKLLQDQNAADTTLDFSIY